MALYFTFYLEYYREEDAVRIAGPLRSWETPFQIEGRTVTNAQVGINAINRILVGMSQSMMLRKRG